VKTLLLDRRGRLVKRRAWRFSFLLLSHSHNFRQKDRSGNMLPFHLLNDSLRIALGARLLRIFNFGVLILPKSIY